MVKSCNTLAELEEEISAARNKLIILAFFAEWCPPCRIMSPELEKLAAEEKDVVFLEVNIVVNQEAADRFYINALPTFIFIKDGAKVDEVLGAHLGKLKRKIKKHAPIKEGQWNSDICNGKTCRAVVCCGPCVCLCCAPIAAYKTADRIGESGILYGLLTCFLPCIGGMLLRRKIRKRYNIEGSDLEDAGISCLCTPCVICQNSNETKDREEL